MKHRLLGGWDRFPWGKRRVVTAVNFGGFRFQSTLPVGEATCGAVQ